MTQWVISSAVLIIVVAALRFALRGRVSPRLQYALWALVLVRLLVPVSFGQAAMSVMNAVPARDEAENVIIFTGGSATVNAGGQRTTFELPQQAGEYGEMRNALTQSGENWSVGGISRSVQLPPAYALVWMAGTLAVGVCLAASNIRFARRLKRDRRKIECDFSPLTVYVSGSVDTPCLFGLFRPAIYLTGEAAGDERTLHHCVAHETTHYRHGDHIWSLLRGVCIAVHWFDPLVWWAAALSRRDAELACDEATVKRLGESERSDYGRTLISLTCKKRGALLLAATTMTGGKAGIKERIALLAKRPRTAVYTLAAVLLIAAIAVGCTFTGAENGAELKPTVEAGVSDSIEASQIVLEKIKSHVDGMIADCNRQGAEAGFSIISAEITELEDVVGPVPVTGAFRSQSGRLHLYRLVYSLNIDHPDKVPQNGGTAADGSYFALWDSGSSAYRLAFCDETKRPYIMILENDEFGVCYFWPVTEEEISRDYGTAEMLQKYADMYTAACRELYKLSVETDGSPVGLDDAASPQKLIIVLLSGDGAYTESAQAALVDSLISDPVATLEAIGSRSGDIQEWICWSLASEIKSASRDVTAALKTQGLNESGTYARRLIKKYVSGDYPAPPSWRQVYMDFFDNTLPDILEDMELIGIGLFDLDFDGIPSLAVWTDESTAAMYYNDGEKGYHNLGGTVSAELFVGHLSDYGSGETAPATYRLLANRESGDAFWSVSRPFDSEDPEGYETADLDYFTFVLSRRYLGDISSYDFNYLLNSWRPIDIYSVGTLEVPASDFLVARMAYELISSDTAFMTLYLAGTGEYGSYALPKDDAQYLSSFFAGIEWTEIEAPPPEPSEFWLTIKSGERSMTVWSDEENILQYYDGSSVRYFRGKALNDSYGTTAVGIRMYYDGLEINYHRVSFSAESAESAAEYFALTAYGEHRLSAAPGSSYGITDYACADWKVDKLSTDGSAVVGSFSFAFKPEIFDSPGIWAGNTVEGSGQWEGWLIMYREFVLQKQDDGLWHCTDFGTGGARLPE